MENTPTELMVVISVVVRDGMRSVHAEERSMMIEGRFEAAYHTALHSPAVGDLVLEATEALLTNWRAEHPEETD